MIVNQTKIRNINIADGFAKKLHAKILIIESVMIIKLWYKISNQLVVLVHQGAW